MTEIERSIFIVERQNELRLVGFFASILERVPLVGIIFSISNRIGYGMMSHDFEKRQRLVLDGKVKKNSVGHRSKTREIELDLPRNSIGNFPKKYDDDDDDCKIRKDK
ncbi:hypothetical protein PPACK8108_LOCUS13073 [Phakopsora pachyrhizi]|uniref:Uncharacterized protein n=1 Tax=Phakopsora pachyrhizi TaxID=170000 RepID=A0AAV0B620_PHAPC|nr:hypothetical protein PPACK8108_LOCUS13073 [Phakopsora pachyrhizi]